MSKELNIKNTGFETPKIYFDSVEDAVFSSLQSEKLKNSTSDPGYSIPEGYFDRLEDEVLSKIDKPETKVISLNTRKLLYTATSIAAILVLYFTLFSKTERNTLDSLDTEVVEAYILEQEIDSYELASLLTDEDIDTINGDIFKEEFNTDQLEEYILENIELESIIEQ